MTAPATEETRTYDLAYVVEETGVPSEAWLRRLLNAGTIRGRRAGRQWRMTTSDIAALVEYMGRGPGSAHAAATLTPTARRGLRRAS